MKKILFCLVLFLSFCVTPQIHASQAKENDVIANLQKTYAKIKTFKAEFKQELFHRESETTQHRNGAILFEQPININWETEKPHAEKLIINKKEIWDYLPEEEIAYRYHPNMLESSHIALSVITGQNKISDNFEIENLDDAEAKSKGFKAFLLYPLEPTPQIVEAQLWIDPKTNLIKKATIIDFYGNSNSITFTEFKINPNIKKQSFIFEPPQGIDIEDHYNQENE